MKKNLGFTLAEILGVIVIIGLLMLLVSPIIMNRINSNKDLADDASGKLIIDAVSQFIDENSDIYVSGNKYCISIRKLIDDGKLVSPVLDIKTGKNIEDYSVLVTIYKSGLRDYNIYNKEECENEEVKPISTQKPLIKVLEKCSDGVVTFEFKDKSGSGLRRYAISDSEKSEDELDWIDLGGVSAYNYSLNAEYDNYFIYLQDGTDNISRKKYNPFIQHMVSFDSNGGTASFSSKSVSNYKTYGNLPNATRNFYGFDAFSFDGWYTEKDGGVKVGSDTKVCLSDNQTLYAHWTAKPIVIRSYMNCKKVIDLNGGKAENGSAIKTYSNNNSNAQKWYPVVKDDGSVVFKSAVNQNYCLDITNGKIANGSLLQLYSCNNSDAQKFIINDNGNGTLSIRSKKDSRFYINVSSAKIISNSQLQIYASNNTDEASLWVSSCPNDNAKPTCGSVTKTSNGTSETITVGCVDTRGSGCTSKTVNFQNTYTSSGNYTITIFDRAGNETGCPVTSSIVVLSDISCKQTCGYDCQVPCKPSKWDDRAWTWSWNINNPKMIDSNKTNIKYTTEYGVSVTHYKKDGSAANNGIACFYDNKMSYHRSYARHKIVGTVCLTNGVCKSCTISG